jgi:hypothetical protein
MVAPDSAESGGDGEGRSTRRSPACSLELTLGGRLVRLATCEPGRCRFRAERRPYWKEDNVKRLWNLIVTVSASTLLLGVLPATHATAALTVTVQHCSTSKNTCLDQTVDDHGEVCAIIKKDSNHHANLCDWDHQSRRLVCIPEACAYVYYVGGDAETCIGYKACVGVDHFEWVYGQITLWRHNNDGSYTQLASGSSDIPSAGKTGPTDTHYGTAEVKFGADSDCQGQIQDAVHTFTHTEVQIRVFWKDGTATLAQTINSDNTCHEGNP